MGVQLDFLSPGINKNIALHTLEGELVHNVTTSTTRKSLFEGLGAFLEQLAAYSFTQCITKFWIDGSFVSEKINPNDIDLVFFLDAMNPMTESLINQRNVLREIGLPLYCDTYYVVDYESIPEGENTLEMRQKFEVQKKYWMGQFCFDRSENVKAIIEMKVEDFR